MSIGSMLIGVALLAVVVAFLARPFRREGAATTDRVIEAWVARAQMDDWEAEEDLGPETTVEDRAPVAQDINYCPQCGRGVEPDDRFCSGCGTRLRKKAR